MSAGSEAEDANVPKPARWYRALVTEGYRVERQQYGIWGSQRIHLRGSVSYDDGSAGTFEAGLIHDDGEWQLTGINVVVPPSKASKP